MAKDPRKTFQNAIHCLESGDLRRAEVLLQTLLKRFPNDQDVLYSLGRIGFISGNAKLIISTMRRCIALNPSDGGAHHNLGNALRSSGRHGEAIAELDRAIQLMANPSEAHNTLGLTLKDLGRLEEAVSAFRVAVAMEPANITAHSNLLLFSNYRADIDPEALFEEHRRWSSRHELPLRNTILPHPNDSNPERKLRVGYISADLRQHSVAYFLLPLLEHLDRERIHVTAYANCAVADKVTRKIQQWVDIWRPIAGAPHDQVAARIRADQIDILVDLAGHTADHRLLVFAQKPAPVQITWLGYPGSTGLEAMDYRCSDPVADPADDPRRLSTEQVLRLPHTTWCYTPLSGAPDVAPLPALTGSGISFGSFNNFGKISTAMIDLWAALLSQIPSSSLLIKNVAMASSTIVEHTHQAFAERGISPDRLRLLKQERSLADHLGRYNQIDISLDTFPYHGTTTTCESLWMGVPVITLAGPNHASRPGCSLLHNVGLAECIAQTPAEYLDKARLLAGDLSRLADLRAGLRRRMQASPLMDSPAFARDMEAAYRRAWRAWCANQSAFERGPSRPHGSFG